MNKIMSALILMGTVMNPVNGNLVPNVETPKGVETVIPDSLKVEGVYQDTMQIVELNYDSDLVSVIDANGNEWEYYGVEDYQLGWLVSVSMYDNGTHEIYDDVILDARWSGYWVTPDGVFHQCSERRAQKLD